MIGDIGICYKTFENCAIVEWMPRFDYPQIISFTPNNDNKNLSKPSQIKNCKQII